MVVRTCSLCESPFEAKGDETKCPECSQHERIFDNILSDVDLERLATPTKYAHPVIRLTPEEAGIQVHSWKQELERILEDLSLPGIRYLADFNLILNRLCDSKRGVDAWTAIVIVSKVYKYNPKVVQGGFNPFRFLRKQHPGVVMLMKRTGKEMKDLFKEALEEP